MLAESGMTAFEMETLESCPSLGDVRAGLFRPVSLIQFRPECANKPPCSVSRIHAGRPAGSQGWTALKIVSRGRRCLTKGETARRSQQAGVRATDQNVYFGVVLLIVSKRKQALARCEGYRQITPLFSPLTPRGNKLRAVSAALSFALVVPDSGKLDFGDETGSLAKPIWCGDGAEFAAQHIGRDANRV